MGFRLFVILALATLTGAFQSPLNVRSVTRQAFKLPRVSSPLFAKNDDQKNNKKKGQAIVPSDDAMILEASSVLYRLSWLSWWAQSILSVVSAVTLMFARNVLRKSSAGGGEGLLLAGTALVVSFFSIFWTWGGARLAKRLVKRNTSRIAAANMTRRAVQVGISINLLGMAVALIGMEQIVGGLAVKVLTQQGVLGTTQQMAVQTLQPLDILVVQGNTNSMLSHFSSLVASLYLTKQVSKLDPPSIEADERKRK